MDGIPITLELVTPAYAGGATSDGTDGLRPPVLKALLRFWWRTLHPHLHSEELFRREEQLFGSTRVGQGLRVVPCDNPGKMGTIDARNRIPDGAAFLAYGVAEYSRGNGFQSTRKAVAPSTRQQRNSVSFRLALPASAPANATSEVVKTLWLLSAFGGWGSKARRGWGSVHVECRLFGQGDYARLMDPHGTQARPELARCLQAGLREVLGPRAALSAAGTMEPAHTAFSRRSSVFLGPPCKTADEAMERIGSTYNDYRRALGARRGHAPGEVGPDHRLKSGWLQDLPGPGDTTPAGSAFGLPHFTRFSNKAQVNVGVRPDLNGRRASPIFFKVVRCGEQYVPVILWLPSLFLPGGDRYAVYVQVKRPDSSGTEAKRQEITYGGDAGISHFLEGKSGLWPGLHKFGWTEVEW